jgi:hypothetical protein
MSRVAGGLLFLEKREEEEHEQEENDEECNDPFDQCGNVTLQVHPSFGCKAFAFSIVHALVEGIDSYRCGCGRILGAYLGRGMKMITRNCKLHIG